MTRRWRAALYAVPLALAIAWCRHETSLPGAAPAGSASTSAEAAGVRFIERITGGASASDTLPLVIGMHGRGGRPESFAHALSSLGVRARLVFPQGFEGFRMGFAWFGPSTSEAAFADDVRRSADRLAPMIVEIARTRPTSGKAIVTGFSQGGIMSYALAVLHPELVRAAFPISSWLPRPLVPATWPLAERRPRVHALHGTADTTIPIAEDSDTVHRLQAIGLRVDLVEYPDVEHEVTRAMQEELTRAVAEACAE